MQRYGGISAPANLFSESTEIFSEKGNGGTMQSVKKRKSLRNVWYLKKMCVSLQYTNSIIYYGEIDIDNLWVITNRMWFEKTDDGSGLQANCGFEEATNSDGRWRVLSLFYAHVATLSGKKQNNCLYFAIFCVTLQSVLVIIT